MVFNHVKLKRSVTLMKNRASIVSLICLPKTLISNNLAFLGSNLMKFAELVVYELKKVISKNIYQYLFSYTIYHCFV